MIPKAASRHWIATEKGHDISRRLQAATTFLIPPPKQFDQKSIMHVIPWIEQNKRNNLVKDA